MIDDIILNKAAILERCVRRVREVYGDDERVWTEDLTKQDSIILNLQRACETAIDLAMHIVSLNRLGVPQRTRDAFELLRDAGLLDAELADRMMRMVGFRNVAVHDYQRLNLEVVRRIAREHLTDFERFAAWALSR